MIPPRDASDGSIIVFCLDGDVQLCINFEVFFDNYLMKRHEESEVTL